MVSQAVKGEGSSKSRRSGRKRADLRVSVARSALLVAFAALLQAVVAPHLAFGFVAPAFLVICVTVAASGMKDASALLLGFFGGTLVDALGAGLFGVGALSGVLAAALAVRLNIAGGGGQTRFRLAGVVAVAVAAHDMVSIAAIGLDGGEWPPAAGFALLGLIPDALLNGLLAYLLGGVLILLVKARR